VTVEELLADYSVDPARLEPAPAEPCRAQTRARYALLSKKPCSACGKERDSRTSRSTVIPGAGPRWVDLCLDHSLAVMPPWRGPTTMEGILEDLREMAAELAAERGTDVPVRLWTDEEGWRDDPC
jgi:hypothetical protein